MKQNIENIISENSVETTNKEYGNGIFISTDAISGIAQDIVKLFSIPIVSKSVNCDLCGNTGYLIAENGEVGEDCYKCDK